MSMTKTQKDTLTSSFPVDRLRTMMTAAEFRVSLIHLDLPQKRFAEMIGYRHETVSRWATGDSQVPQIAELVIELLRYKASMSQPGEAA